MLYSSYVNFLNEPEPSDERAFEAVGNERQWHCTTENASKNSLRSEAYIIVSTTDRIKRCRFEPVSTESTPQIAIQTGRYSDGRPIQFKSIFLQSC